jgi:hypothetical protein
MNRGLWCALLEAWPTKQGPRPNYYAASYAAQAVDRLGATLEDVAAERRTKTDSARSFAAAGRERFEWQDVEAPTVVVADAAAGTLPRDPVLDDAWLDALLPSRYHDGGDERDQRDALLRTSRAVKRARDRQLAGLPESPRIPANPR